MNAYAHWTPDSGTAELPRSLRGPYWETQTQEIHILDLKPRVTRYRHQSLVARLWLGFLASAFVQDVKSRIHIVPQAVGILTAAFVFILVLRGLAVVADVAGIR